MAALYRFCKGFLLIFFVLAVIFLVGHLDKGVETHEPDQLHVYPKFGQSLPDIVARVEGAKIVNEYENIVQIDPRRLTEFEDQFLADEQVLGIKRVAVVPEFTLRKYVSEVRRSIEGYTQGDFGGISYKVNDPKNDRVYPITQHLGDMVKKSFTYLGAALLFGLVTGYLLALTAVWKPKLGRALDSLHTVLLGIPDFFIVVLLQFIAIQLAKAAGENVFLIMEFAGQTPFLIPFLAISILPAALIYGTLRLAVEREWEEGYVKTAYAKGLTRTSVILFHILRNTRADLFAILPRAVTVSITSLVVAEIMSGIFGLAGYALNPKLSAVSSLPLTCSLLAVIGLTAHFLLAALRRRIVVNTKEVA